MTILRVFRHDGKLLDEITGWMRPVRIGEQIEIADRFYTCRAVRWRRHEPVEEIVVEPVARAGHVRDLSDFSQRFDLPLDTPQPLGDPADPEDDRP